jgi:outer membrane receptor for ferrienterochelin and colicins
MVRVEIIILLLGFFVVFKSNAQSIDTTKIQPVEIQGEQSGEVVNSNGAILSQNLNENEFKKAACCTLSESFDLSNAIEVSNADGISGIKQVEMLGLHSRYVLLTRDNIPLFQGLAVLNGLTNIPGPFVSDVNIAKGTGSATLGYDGITGGINYLLKASPKDPNIFIK